MEEACCRLALYIPLKEYSSRALCRMAEYSSRALCSPNLLEGYSRLVLNRLALGNPRLVLSNLSRGYSSWELDNYCLPAASSNLVCSTYLGCSNWE